MKLAKLFTIVLAICLMIVPFSSCNKEDSSAKNDYSNKAPSSITKSQAISYAKNSKTLEYEIADLYNLKFYYPPDWGTVTANETYPGSGHWEISLRGTISGYTDDYKTDFVYDKKFTALVKVSSSGWVTVEYVWRS